MVGVAVARAMVWHNTLCLELLGIVLSVFYAPRKPRTASVIVRWLSSSGSLRTMGLRISSDPLSTVLTLYLGRSSYSVAFNIRIGSSRWTMYRSLGWKRLTL